MTLSRAHSDEHILAQLSDPKLKEQGFRQLMTKYQARLYQQVRSMTGSHDDTNDVLQNVYIKVFKNIDRFKRQSQLFTWLYRIASNETLSFLEQKKRKTGFYSGTPEVNQLAVEQIRTTKSPSPIEIQQHLQGAIKKLPERQRMVFCLRYFDEMPYKEMAEILGLSVGALKASYHHAVKKVEQILRQ